eukprot:1965686-Rhodomonas_salina.1
MEAADITSIVSFSPLPRIGTMFGCSPQSCINLISRRNAATMSWYVTSLLARRSSKYSRGLRTLTTTFSSLATHVAESTSPNDPSPTLLFTLDAGDRPGQCGRVVGGVAPFCGRRPWAFNLFVPPELTAKRTAFASATRRHRLRLDIAWQARGLGKFLLVFGTLLVAAQEGTSSRAVAKSVAEGRKSLTNADAGHVDVESECKGQNMFDSTLTRESFVATQRECPELTEVGALKLVVVKPKLRSKIQRTINKNSGSDLFEKKKPTSMEHGTHWYGYPPKLKSLSGKVAVQRWQRRVRATYPFSENTARAPGALSVYDP